jgi:ABC-type sugar transport system ATPase subunit
MRAKLGSLSGGQRQGVAIARALGWGRSIVVLDEPTAALGIHETLQVEKNIANMRHLGLGLLLVSHDLDQVFRVADHIYVLYHGRVVGDVGRQQTSRDEVVALITGAAHAGNGLVGA